MTLGCGDEAGAEDNWADSDLPARDHAHVDAVAQYLRASEQSDLSALMAALALEAELVSPLSGHMVFRDRDDLRVLLDAVYGSLTGLRWQEQVGNGSLRVVTGECRIAGLERHPEQARRLRPKRRARLSGPIAIELPTPEAVARRRGSAEQIRG